MVYLASDVKGEENSHNISGMLLVLTPGKTVTKIAW